MKYEIVFEGEFSSWKTLDKIVKALDKGVVIELTTPDYHYYGTAVYCGNIHGLTYCGGDGLFTPEKEYLLIKTNSRKKFKKIKNRVKKILK